MEGQKAIFFITSYEDSMINKYIININNKDQKKYYKIKKEYNGKQYSIFINEIDISSKLNENIEIPIEIIKSKSNSSKEINKYSLEIKDNQEQYTFLFNYSLKAIKEDFVFELYWIKSVLPWHNPEIFINVDILNYKKFNYFFYFLLSCKDDIDNYKNYYIRLSRSYIEEIENNKEQESINIEIIISILISSLYDEKKFSIFYHLKLKDKKIDYLNNINLISSFKEQYCSMIIKIMEILKENEDKEIFEIIIIYFIKFDRENLNIMFEDDCKKKILFNIFKQEKLNFISDEILDDKIKEIFINHSPNIESILSILKKNENYISYLKTIENNFDKIYDAIAPLKSLKGLFDINFKVSLEDDYNELIKLHNNILEKEKQKNKYIINFIPIIKKYFQLYTQNYHNLKGLCSLEIMTYEELNIFKNISKIKEIYKKIIEKIKELLIENIKKNNLKGIDAIYIISKLKHHFKDEAFNVENKKFLLLFIINKFKENDENMIKDYKKNEIWKLFFDNNEKENNIYLDILKKQDYNGNDKFIELFPEEIDQKQEEVILDIIKKIINKENDIDVENKDSYYYFFKIFFKKKNMFSNFMNFFEDKMESSKNINILISFFNKNIQNADKNNIKIFINSIDRLLQKDIYFFKDVELMIPIYILERTTSIKSFQKLFLKKLSNFIINENDIYSDDKKNKFLLLEQIIDKNLFLYEYKEKTDCFIKNLIKNRYNEKHKNLIKIYNNKVNKKNYYDKIIKILDEDQKNNLNRFLMEIGNNENYIKSFENIEDYLSAFFPSKKDEILKIKLQIEKLKNGPINLKDEKEDFSEIIKKYKNNKINDDIKKKILCVYLIFTSK